MRKGDKSKTHRGDRDFTTKRGNLDFHQHGHDVKLGQRHPYTRASVKGEHRDLRLPYKTPEKKKKNPGMAKRSDMLIPPGRSLADKNKPLYAQYLPFVYDAKTKSQGKFSKDLLVPTAGKIGVTTTGYSFASPAPKSRISYDSSNAPNPKMYNASRFDYMASRQLKENNSRLKIAQARFKTGEGVRRPACGCAH